MSDKALFFFNWWGLLFLAVFALGFCFSHIFAIKGLKSIDLAFRIVAFIALILIFMISGWRAGLIALPIGLLISILGAMMTRSLRPNL